MAIEPPSYQRQQLPRPARLADPGPGGAEAIAEGLGAAGQAWTRHVAGQREDELRITAAQDRAKVIEDERQLRDRASSLSVALATRQGELQTTLAGLRASAGPGAAGHDEAVDGAVQRFREGFGDLIGPDTRLQDEFLPRLAEVAAAARTGETRWAIEQRAARQATDAGDLAGQLGSTMQTAALDGSATGAALTAAEGQWDSYVDRLALPDNARAELRRDGHRTIQQGAMLGVIERNPQAAVAAIDGGWGERLFSPHERAVLRNQAVTQQEHVEALARQAASAAAGQARASAGNLIEDVNAGTLVPPAQLEAALAQAQADPSAEGVRLVHDIQIAMARNAATARYDPAPPAERAAALREIEAHRGWQSNPQLVAAHTQIIALNERDAHRVSDDMLGLYVRQTGTYLPPFDMANPATMRTYFAAGDAAAARYGRPPQYLPQEAAQQLHQAWEAGTPAARAQMIAQMAAFGPDRAGALIRQITPEPAQAAANAALIQLATMRDRGVGAAYVREALDGWATPQSERAAQPSRMQALLRASYGAALQGMPGDARAAVIRVAEGIYAHRAARRNLTSLDDELWRQSIGAALGQVGETGGLGRAANGEGYIVPRGWTDGDVHMNVARSNPRQVGAAAGDDSPIWADGRVVPPATMLTLTPELISDDGRHAYYRFRSASGYVGSRRQPGHDFVLDLRGLAEYVHGRRTVAPAGGR